MPDSATYVERRKKLTSVEAAAVAGLVFAVLSFASLTILMRLPSPSSSTEIEAFYTDSAERRLDFISLTMATFAAIAFLWFLAVVRRRLGDREDQFFSTVFLGSGLAYVALMLVGTGIAVGPSVAIDFADGVTPGQDVYSLAIGTGYGILLSVVPRLQAVFVITTSTLFLRTGAVYRWLAYVGYAIAVVMILVPILTRPAGIGLPVWVALVSLVLFVRKREIADTAPAASDDASPAAGPDDL